MRLQFLDGTLIVTNRGAMNFTRLDLSGAAADTNLVVQVGSTGAGTFRNEGLFVTGIGGATADKSRALVFSNTFVNAGMFVLTNGNAGARSTNLFSVVGSGLTNRATGTIKLTAISGSTGPRNVMTLNAGGFVNAGTLISDAGGSANISNLIFIAVGQAFSNAAGGQIILDSVQTGQLAIYADKVVNAGTNSISSGTLNYFTSSGGAGILENSGTILLMGGNLSVDTVTNTATGTIKATTGNNTFNVANAGTIDLTTAVLSNGASGTVWTNQATGRILLSDGTLSGGQIHNLGTVQTTAGLDTLRNAGGTVITNDLGGTYIVGGAALRFSTAFTAGGSSNTFYNGGTFTYNSGTIAVGSFINTNVFNVAHTFTGTMDASAAAGRVFSNAVNGQVIVSSGTIVYASGGLDNLGVINAFGSGVFGNSGPDFTNTATGMIINTNGAATLGARASAGGFVNLGNIVVSNGATINWLQTSGQGNTLTNSAGARLIIGNAVSDGVFNSGTLANSGTVNGSGTISLAIGSSGRPLVNLDSGTLKVLDNRVLTVTNVSGAAYGLVVIPNGQTNTYNIYNSGTMIVGSGASQLRYSSGTNSGGANFALSMLNVGTLQMNGGTLTFITPTESIVSNFGTGLIRGSGTITNAALVNSGTILADSSGALVLAGSSLNNSGVVTANLGRIAVSGVFTNSGTLTMIGSVGTFNGAVVNSGAWITDPSTNVFNNTFTVTPTGSIQAAAGDVYVFKKDFVNHSTQSNTWNTLNTAPGSTAPGTKFVFVGDGSSTQQFFQTGLRLTGGFVGTPGSATGIQFVTSLSAMAGFQTNFALGSLDITNTTLLLSQAIPGAMTNALFVDNLDIFGAADLIISNNMQLYFINSNNWDMANVTLLGNAEIHQLEVASAVPEPSVLLLWASGLATVCAARRNAIRRSR